MRPLTVLAWVGFGALLLPAALVAQQPSAAPTLRFEVVAIRPIPPNTPPTLRDPSFTPVLPGGHFMDSRTTLFSMMILAYDIKNPMVQLVGLPSWGRDHSYSVEAKPSADFATLTAAANRDQVRIMLRAMLADRFRLQVHTETREAQIVTLDPAKGGIKIKEVEPPTATEKAAPLSVRMSDSSGRMIGKKSTMADIAEMLVVFLKRPVIDHTGLAGCYDFDVKWSAPEGSGGQPDRTGFGAEGEALLIATLRDQLGLRLTATTGPVDYWVVDHAEPPTEN
jgi:uncharacterized protein (TIGR03435 family)